MRKRIGTKLIVVSPMNVNVFPHPYIRVPDVNIGKG